MFWCISDKYCGSASTPCVFHGKYVCLRFVDVFWYVLVYFWQVLCFCVDSDCFFHEKITFLSIWEASESYLGGIWEATDRPGLPGCPEPPGINILLKKWRKNAKVPLKYQFYDLFLKVTSRFIDSLQCLLLPGSVHGLRQTSRAL